MHNTWTEIELRRTLLPCPTGHDWSAGIDGNGIRRDSLYPLAGDDVVTCDGRVGIALHTSPGRPPLPPGGQHRYVVTSDNEIDPTAPVLAYHVSRLRPFAIATEVQ
jgi:hypothetical protein